MTWILRDDPVGGAGSSGKQETLTIGCFASIGRDRLADQLLRLARIYPDVVIGVREMALGALLPALRLGGAQLVVAPVVRREQAERSTPLWTEEVNVLLPPHHRLATLPSVAPADLSEDTFLVARQDHGDEVHRFLSRRILPLGPPLHCAVVDRSRADTIRAVAEGRGLMLACESQAGEEASDVVVRPIRAAGATFTVRAFWRPDRESPAIRALVDLLRSDAPTID
jgi:DNA-binding transcriptional LysR family regulator